MYDIQIQYDIPVAMSDGTVLRTDVYRPVGPGPWPVVVVRKPYGKTACDDLIFAEPWTGARRGNIVVVQDVRGRSLSTGDDWVLSVAEGRDGLDTIAWAADLPGSNGNVGMWGGSYLGNLRWRAAAEHPPALKAIAPQITWQSPRSGVNTPRRGRRTGPEARWPLDRAVDTRMHLNPDGSLDDIKQPIRKTMSYTYDPADPVPTLGGNTLLLHPPAGPIAQTVVEARDDVLTFRTAPLSDVEVTGRVSAHLTVSTGGPTTDWVVRLCDVDPQGRSINPAGRTGNRWGINDGGMIARNHVAMTARPTSPMSVPTFTATTSGRSGAEAARVAPTKPGHPVSLVE